MSGITARVNEDFGVFFAAWHPLTSTNAMHSAGHKNCRIPGKKDNGITFADFIFLNASALSYCSTAQDRSVL